MVTAGVPRAWATHGGEDVPVFAIGPLASVLFSGSVDQSYIPHAISYASCLGHYASRCSRDSSSSNDTMSAPISCPSAEPNSAAISSDVMNDQARNPPTKSAASLEPVGSRDELMPVRASSGKWFSVTFDLKPFDLFHRELSFPANPPGWRRQQNLAAPGRARARRSEAVQGTICDDNDYPTAARGTLPTFKAFTESKWGLQVLRDEDTSSEIREEFPRTDRLGSRLD
ncbi:hypothetical protein K0M31_003607 [Melipona bicolor]|uniref:alkaline phosphatase n=1 Tax=Melipona bicolor TaxID=60889 RepID=A0AA40FZ97_9HYME|nr:hypothetical protein K0M31_003607 [Melipona bicolor]